MKQLCACLKLVMGMVLFPASVALAEPNTFLPATGNWNLAGNWSDGVPSEGQDVLIPAGKTVVLDVATANLASFEIAAGATVQVDGWDNWITATTVSVKGTLTTTGPFETAADSPAARVYVSCGDLTVPYGGTINVDGKGWAGGRNGVGGYLGIANAGFGPGASLVNPAGAAHGGLGAIGETSTGFDNRSGIDRARYGYCYDDPYAPLLPGSGGAANGGTAGCAGGGAIRIVATGTVTVYGPISANAYNNLDNHSNKGSGGSIWITCKTFAGAGPIRANGGSGYYGAWPDFIAYYHEGGKTGNPRVGGGGMIRVEYETQTVNKAMEISAAAGYYNYSGFYASTCDKYRIEADLGTVTFTDDAVVTALLGCGLSGRLVGVTNFTYSTDLLWKSGHVRFAGEGANVVFNGNLTLSNNTSRLEIGGIDSVHRRALVMDRYAGTKLNSCTVKGDLMLKNFSAFDIRAAETNATMRWGGEVKVEGNLDVQSGYVYSWCDIKNFGASHFVVAGDVMVESDGAIIADRRGGPGGAGSGSYTAATQAGTEEKGWMQTTIGKSIGLGGNCYSGASHGGYGAKSWQQHSGDAGSGYGSYGQLVPDEWLACYPGAGGGSDGYGCGGEGGGLVYIEAKGDVTVNGRISANGGTGFYNGLGSSSALTLYAKQGAGAGGAVYLTGRSLAGTGVISARGGDAIAGTAGNYIYAAGCGGGGRIVIMTNADLPPERISKVKKDAAGTDSFVRELVSFTGTYDVSGGTNIWNATGKTGTPYQVAESHGSVGTVRFMRNKERMGVLLIVR